ncbi:hydrolase [Castellaniella defragrans 65Phen]|uniref:Hydrolase n=1 Tax=Castellaniella defragrans (strain DSM 12143 / CCUG 39792 / 65Phen) TaxID=1437824 RepID=W8X462_CASD6|nr:alpha/beta hydrolase [Castellaniella defragrans]CDM24161.1 hydrolase [Castellaniella defragrans 65Phen]
MNDTRPTFVLLHGLLCDADTWADFIGPLSRLGHVLAADLSGIDSLPEAAREILARTTGPLIVAGHSMGGRVALEMARRAPRRCRALILMNTGYRGLGEGESEKRMALVRAARAGGIQAIADGWLDGMIASATRGDAALMARMRAMVLRSTPDSFAGQIQALIGRPDASGLLGRLACPVLLMSGTEDRWSPLDRHADMASRVPDATLEAIGGAGHMAPFEAPAACLSAITGWLARRGLSG